MKYINTGDVVKGAEVRLFYTDDGEGRPVVLLHGWPIGSDMWEYQVPELVAGGFRCITYDRRGFGASSRPWHGYDFNTLASDLNALMEALDLKDAVLAAFAMGSGEVVRYLSRYGSRRVSGIVLISTMLPYLNETADNPDGLNPMVFADVLTNMREDRIGFLDDWGRLCFGVNLLRHTVSKPLLDYYRALGAQTAPRALQQCVRAFAITDFRADVAAVRVPALLIHGASDKVMPIEATGNRVAALLPGCRYLVYEEAPHGLFYTHRHQLNRDLLKFMRP